MSSGNDKHNYNSALNVVMNVNKPIYFYWLIFSSADRQQNVKWICEAKTRRKIKSHCTRQMLSNDYHFPFFSII